MEYVLFFIQEKDFFQSLGVCVIRRFDKSNKNSFSIVKTKNILAFVVLIFFASISLAQTDTRYTLLKPARVFDGEQMHTDWVVLIQGDSIVQAGPMRFKLPADTKIIELPNQTLLPGLIEGHSHLFLHPYNEVSWDDQVLKESRSERTVRAVNHAKATLLAGFTTIRDLGTEGAEFDDAGLKSAIEKKLIPGPRMIIATKAIVAKGSYGPKSTNADIHFHQGAAEVGNVSDMQAEVRMQISKGADLIKIYADYRWGIDGESAPTFTIEEIAAAVAIAKSGNRKVVAHATTPEGMRRAIMAGVSTIEHGDQGTKEIFQLMKEKGVALCPTLAAGDAVEQYRGWKKGSDPETERIRNKRTTFQLALQTGVTICMGGDVGVYEHGDNARELELMVAYGMKPIDVLRSCTSINADVFGYANKIGRVKKGLQADLIAVEGDPGVEIKAIRKIRFVMKAGTTYEVPPIRPR
ncbi:MAG: amidohydrolase family protein [Chitinophagaceae bacterium]|nr:amidohydrolase family protein [Chitinophagaceae bacterium]